MGRCGVVMGHCNDGHMALWWPWGSMHPQNRLRKWAVDGNEAIDNEHKQVQGNCPDNQ
jgi:hypothetical protein